MTPELKIALIRVSGEYLDKINNSRFDEIQGMIILGDYLREDKRMSKEAFIAQIAKARLTWKDKPQSHPLVGLDLESMELKGNDAVVKLKKFKVSDSPIIELKLHWSGQGWLIYDDNIFGQGRLMEKLIEQKNSSAS